MIVREAVPADHAAMSRFYEELDRAHARGAPELFCDPPTPGRPAPFLEARRTAPDTGVFVAEVAGTVAGFAIVRLAAIPDLPILRRRRFAHVEDIVVGERHRRAGVGRALCERVVAWSRDHGATQIELVVFEFNRGAIEFYEALGFRTSSRRLELRL